MILCLKVCWIVSRSRMQFSTWVNHWVIISPPYSFFFLRIDGVGRDDSAAIWMNLQTCLILSSNCPTELQGGLARVWLMKLLIATLYALIEPSALAFFQVILGSASGGWGWQAHERVASDQMYLGGARLSFYIWKWENHGHLWQETNGHMMAIARVGMCRPHCSLTEGGYVHAGGV